MARRAGDFGGPEPGVGIGHFRDHAIACSEGGHVIGVRGAGTDRDVVAAAGFAAEVLRELAEMIAAFGKEVRLSEAGAAGPRSTLSCHRNELRRQLIQDKRETSRIASTTVRATEPAAGRIAGSSKRDGDADNVHVAMNWRPRPPGSVRDKRSCTST